jgi:hypothetical protein
VFKFKPWIRRWLTWFTPYTHLFQLEKMTPEDYSDDSKNRIAAGLQNEYLKAIMKVLTRFPGLINEHDDDGKTVQRYEGWSTWPLKQREKYSPENPLAKLFEVLCTKKTSRVKKAKSNQKEEDLDAGYSDTDEDEVGHGDGAEAGDGSEVEAENGAGMSL